MLTHEITTDLVTGLTNILTDNITQIILYGSVARQEDTAESDIAIILEKSFDSVTKERFIAWADMMDLKYEKVFSIIDIGKDLFDKWGNTILFYKNICKEGIILWTAA